MMLARGNACLRMIDVSVQLNGSTVLYSTLKLAESLLEPVHIYARAHPGFMPVQHLQELGHNLQAIQGFKGTYKVTWGNPSIEERGEGQLTETVTLVYNWASGRPQLLVSDEPRLEEITAQLVSRVHDVKNRQYRGQKLIRRDLQLLLAVAIDLEALQRIVTGCCGRPMNGTVENLFIQLFDEFNSVVDRLTWRRRSQRYNPFAVVGDGALETLMRFTAWVVEAAKSGEHIPTLQGRVVATEFSYRRIDEMFEVGLVEEEREVTVLEDIPDEIPAVMAVEEVAAMVHVEAEQVVVPKAEEEAVCVEISISQVSDESLEVAAGTNDVAITTDEVAIISDDVVGIATDNVEEQNKSVESEIISISTTPAVVGCVDVIPPTTATEELVIGVGMEEVLKSEEEIIISSAAAAIAEDSSLVVIFQNEEMPEKDNMAPVETVFVPVTDDTLNGEVEDDCVLLVDPCLDDGEEQEQENELEVITAVLESSRADLGADCVFSFFPADVTTGVLAMPAGECEEALALVDSSEVVVVEEEEGNQDAEGIMVHNRLVIASNGGSIPSSQEAAAVPATQMVPLALIPLVLEDVEETEVAQNAIMSPAKSLLTAVEVAPADAATLPPPSFDSDSSSEEEIALLIGDMLDKIISEVEAKVSEDVLSEVAGIEKIGNEFPQAVVVVSLYGAENYVPAKTMEKAEVNEEADENVQPTVAADNLQLVAGGHSDALDALPASLMVERTNSRAPLAEIVGEDTVLAAVEYVNRIMEGRATQEVERVEERENVNAEASVGAGSPSASIESLPEPETAVEVAVAAVKESSISAIQEVREEAAPVSAASSNTSSEQQPDSFFIKIVRGMGHALATVAAVVTTGWEMVCRFMGRRR